MSSSKTDVNELKEHSRAEAPKSQPVILYPLTRIQQAAIQLYDLGFNVMPIPRVGMEHGGKKPPYGKFSVLFSSRLGRSSLATLFERSNLAVICGRLSKNLFILDCDKQQTFKWIGQELANHKIDPWVTESARGGHYWLLSSEGEVINTAPLVGLDILGNHKYVVAPPSVHPTGVIYEWVKQHGSLPPAISLERLSFLEGVTLVKEKKGHLPPVAHRVLEEGNTEGYLSNSEAELASALSLAKVGYIKDEIISIFEKCNPPHFTSKKNPTGWLQRYLLPKAFEYANSAPNPTKRISWAKSRPWPGRTGETDKRVFLALCYRAQLDGQRKFRASVREVSELANIDKKTANRSLKRLMPDLISWVGKDSKSGANLYCFEKDWR